MLSRNLRITWYESTVVGSITRKIMPSWDSWLRFIDLLGNESTSAKCTQPCRYSVWYGPPRGIVTDLEAQNGTTQAVSKN